MHSETAVIFGLFLSMLTLVILTARIKLHPFLSLIFSALVYAVISGMKLSDTIQYFSEGLGNTMADIGIVIALGTITGVLFEKSGSAETVARSIFRLFGEKRISLGLAVAGYFVCIPIFCDTAYVILSPIAKRLSRASKLSMTTLALSLFAGLHATHVLVPPTPGPLSATGILGANVQGMVMLGALTAIPVTLVGCAAAGFIGKRHYYLPSDIEDFEDDKPLPPAPLAFLTILTPLFLMMIGKISTVLKLAGFIAELINFFGTPVVSIFISFLIAAFTYAVTYPGDSEAWGFDGIIADAIRIAGQITLIICAGGAFSAVLTNSGLKAVITELCPHIAAGLLAPFVIGFIFRSCIGSATVAMVTGSSLITPFLGAFGLDSPIGRVLAVLSCGAGALAVFHGNDDFFWVISTTSEMDTLTAYKTLPVLSILQSVTALICVLLLGAILI